MNMLDIEPGLATTMSGGPAEAMVGIEPEPATSVIIELMGEGSGAEKDPAPVAGIIANGPAAEAILQRMAESEGLAADDEGQDGERFVPYEPLIGEPAEIWGGITLLGESPESLEAADNFIKKLIGSVERPSDEDPEASDGVVELQANEELSSEENEIGRGRAALLALRRSRLGRVVAGAAVVGSGMLYWASTASGETLEQQCIDAGMKPLANIDAIIKHVHRNDGNGWHGHAYGQLDAMPQECTDNDYYRVVNYRAQIQNGEHRSQWRTVIPWVGSDWNGHRGNYGTVFNDSGNRMGIGIGNINYQHDHHWTRFQYICSPGSAKTGFRFQEMNTVIQTSGNIDPLGATINGPLQIVSPPKVRTHAIRVPGAC